jgi:glucan 1,3-beta-glucosidase
MYTQWSLQTRFNNTFVNRKTIFDTERYAFNRYESGSAFWTAVSYANGDVDGEGIVSDYWSYTKLINEGVITPMTTEDFC